MREYRAALDNTQIPLSSLDTAIEWLLVALLAFMPLALGVRTARGEEIVIALSGIIVICFLLKLLFSGRGPIWTWAYVPVVLFVLIAAFQLLPLPARLASIISPNTVALKTELLGDLPNADKLLKSTPLSFYLNDTKHDLRLLLALAGVFAVVFNVFRRPEQIKRILLAIAVIGGIVAAIALVQDLFGNGRIYWFISIPHSKTLSGPFVNHSHYGQFMNLSIGAALGWLCVKLREDFGGKKTTPSAVYEYLGSTSARGLWLLAAMMVLGTATVFVSLTRGGMLSMLTAAAFVTLLLTARPSLKSHGWIMVVTAIGAFACILYIGFDAVYDRFASLRHLQQYQVRWQILKDLTASYRQFPVLGTGLGTHAVVYPMFKHINSALLFTHAENEYAQVMEEAGLVGLSTLILFAVAVWSSFAGSIRRAGLPICLAAYGLGFGLAAVLVHSLSDFGQHVPANAFLSATFCALLLSLAQQRKKQDNNTYTTPSSWNFGWARVVISLAVCGIWAWALIGADNARKAEARWERALDIEKGLIDRNWRGSDVEYAALIRHAAAASDYQPQNVLYRYWLNVYRWRSISQATDPKTGQVAIAADSMPTVRDIVDEFHKACALCPTYGPPYSVVGQIEKFILSDDAGAEKIRRGFRLAPSDPVTCIVAGRLDVLEGRTQDCIAKFEKAVQLDGSLFKDVAAIYVYQLSRPHLAISLAGDDIGRLTHVANILDDMQYTDLAAQARVRITRLLEAKCSRPDASGRVFASLGGIYGKQQNSEAAAECYRQALAREYGHVYWRLELAKLFVKMGRFPEAMYQAKICLQLQPQYKPAEQLVADLSVHPDVLSKSIESP
jgi:tetratricopeptide (TPR) repeat protein/O-antigen ligase